MFIMTIYLCLVVKKVNRNKMLTDFSVITFDSFYLNIFACGINSWNRTKVIREAE